MLTRENKVQLNSHRNSLQAHLSLLEKSGASICILPSDGPTVTKEILTHRNMRTLQIPLLMDLLDPPGTEEHFPWDRDFEPMRTHTACVLHTSGSSGIPKPVYVAHGTFASNDMHQAIQPLGGKSFVYDSWRGKRVFVALPIFHAACLGMILGYNVFQNVVCVLPPPELLTVDHIEKVHQYAKVSGSLLPPSMIMEVFKKQRVLDQMIEQVEFVAYVGGSLAQDVGDRISQQVKLITLMGSTEAMWLPVEEVDEPENWKQIPISPFLGHEYRSTRDELCELFIVRNPKLDLFQGVFATFPEKVEYGMQYLYVQHPTDPRLWMFSARGDDIICFSNAEKLNPITIETTIGSHPLVIGAVVGGHEEFQASLLLEPHVHPATERETEEFIDAIWPAVVETNINTVAHGRIMKNFIFLSDPDRPLPRAGKDTIQRHATLDLYAEEFKQLYRKGLQVPSEQLLQPKRQGSVASNITARSLLDTDTTNRASSPTDKICEKLDLLTGQVERILVVLEGERARLKFPTLEYHEDRIDRLDADKGANGVHGADRHNESDRPTGTVHRPYIPTSPIYSPDVVELKSMLFHIISETIVVFGLTASADLYKCGLDSLQTPALVSAINKALSSSDNKYFGQVGVKDIQGHPSIDELALCIADHQGQDDG